MKKRHIAKLLETLSEEQDRTQRMVDGLHLLEVVWLDIGPYNRGPVSEETLRLLRDYFEFDDSE